MVSPQARRSQRNAFAGGDREAQYCALSPRESLRAQQAGEGAPHERFLRGDPQIKAVRVRGPPRKGRVAITHAEILGGSSWYVSRARGAVGRSGNARRRARRSAERFAGTVGPVGEREVAERDDPDQPLVAVEHRQPAHLEVGHVLRDVVEVVVVEAVFDLLAHHVAHLGVRALALRHRAHRDVAVGDHADQAVVLADRQHAGVDLRHQAGRVADRLVRVGDPDVLAHGIA